MTERPSLLDDEQLDACVVRGREDALVRHYGAEAVAWSPLAPTPSYLDPLAALVWQLLDGEVPISAILDDVNEVLGVPQAVARNQIRRVIRSLEGSSLLSTSPAPPSRPSEEVHFPLPPNP